MQTYKSISDYIKRAPKEHRDLLELVQTTLAALVPQGEQVIRYGMPTIQLNGKNLVHFAAMKGHLGFYPGPSGVKVVEEKLKKESISFSKGCIRFPYNKTLPISLITKIVKFRLKEEKEQTKK